MVNGSGVGLDVRPTDAAPVLPYRELLLGCGSKHAKHLSPPEHKEWINLTTLDVEECHKPDVLWDLNKTPWPFEDQSFNEIHAYEVLEHLGTQGDWKAFFDHFSEIWRILRPKGTLFASVPLWNSQWAWGDPGHTRVITPGSLVFLMQKEYEQHVGVNPMSDYRSYYKADFVARYQGKANDRFFFALERVG